MKTAAFVANASKPEAMSLVRELHERLAARGVAGVCDEPVGRALGLPWAESAELARAEFCIVLGGDGTLLRASRLLGGRPVPILGVNLGALGFMTEVPLPELDSMLERVLAGEFSVEPRMKLRVVLVRGSDERQVLEGEVLNEAVLAKGALARIADLECLLGGAYVTTYKSDGVIVSTPTGSTAYSLSAAGPILYPTMQGIIINPICPHTLTQRPIVVPEDRTIELVLRSQSEEMYLTLDGQSGLPLLPGDRVRIERSPNQLLLIKNPRLDFFSILRTKLRWGER